MEVCELKWSTVFNFEVCVFNLKIASELCEWIFEVCDLEIEVCELVENLEFHLGCV